ncbi:MAG TPA: DUF3300 domain-containing protein [Phycisphaerae bacterium]|nr:DUF3300 domain-containing protein [Phycisphaerae bacterium]
MSTTRSKFRAALVAIGWITSLAGAETYYYTPGAYVPQTYAAPPVPTYPAPAAPTLTADQLNQLLAPIALYPDPLLTMVLAAATYPQDIAAAQQWLAYFPNPTEDAINAEPWDPSVKALVHYPTVLAMMASQPDWTASLGAAFANQPQDVMNTVQELRAEAQTAQTLVSTSQQQVITDNGAIEIIPAQPNIIYVPQYDPAIVYYQRPYYYSQPLITFGPAFGVGAWLNLDWDWHRHHVDEGVHWDRDWRHPDYDHVREWRHNPGRPIVVPHDFGHDYHREDHRNGRGPGWDHGPERPPAFDVHGGRVDERNHAPERPVYGIPNRPEPAPQPRPGEGPHPVEPPHAPVPPGRVDLHEPAHVNERPVQGIPHSQPEPAFAPRASTVGSAHVAPPPSAPSAFHSEGGANVQSGRGNGSMHR